MKPLLALAGIALLGTAGLAGALIIGRLGGEEEVASQAQETPAPAPTQELPDGWVRFSHPGTQEAPPFSFAYPDELNVKGAALVPVTLPKGEPLGTAVLVELFSWDPGAAPSIILPADAMYLKVFVGPYAPLESCGPDNFGDPAVLGGVDGRRMVSVRAPASTTDSIIVYAITPDDCYALDSTFSLGGRWEDVFNRIVASFRLGEPQTPQSETPSLTPLTDEASPVTMEPTPGWTRYEHTKWGYRIDYPSGWYDLPNFGAPDAQKYFSNEPVRAPLEMDENGVWITITVSNLVGQDCANASLYSGVIESSSDLPIAGGTVARHVVHDTSVEGGPRVVLNLESNGSCYTFYIITFSEKTRRELLPLIDEVLESFAPPSATSLSLKGALPES